MNYEDKGIMYKSISQPLHILHTSFYLFYRIIIRRTSIYLYLLSIVYKTPPIIPAIINPPINITMDDDDDDEV